VISAATRLRRPGHVPTLIDTAIIANLMADLPGNQIAEVIQALLTEIDHQLAMLRLAQGAPVQRTHAHHLSGLAATVGAADLAAAAGDFETAILQGRRPDIEPLLVLASQSREIIEQVVRGET